MVNFASYADKLALLEQWHMEYELGLENFSTEMLCLLASTTGDEREMANGISLLPSALTCTRDGEMFIDRLQSATVGWIGSKEGQVFAQND